MAYTTINKSGDYFNTKLYTGNGTNGHAITGVGFQPDLIWLKSRSLSEHNIWSDAVRGADKQIYSNLAYAEATATSRITSFTSDGFTLGSGDLTNKNGETYATWNWKSNGAGSSNTDGTITSTVSANTTAGFSIVKYTGNASAGATIGHGLGVIPKVMIVKNLSEAYNWAVYHEGLGSHTKYLYLDATNAVATDSGNFDNVPTSSTFLVGSNSTVNKNGNNYIAYCFAEKTGYSKFGSYVGNGNADGTFVYTGFKPAWILVKKTSASGNGWFLMDTKRNTYNPKSIFFQANLSSAETDVDRMDILSNGFKPRYDWSIINESGATYIYMAFAEAPLVGSNNVPCTAR